MSQEELLEVSRHASVMMLNLYLAGGLFNGANARTQTAAALDVEASLNAPAVNRAPNKQHDIWMKTGRPAMYASPSEARAGSEPYTVNSAVQVNNFVWCEYFGGCGLSSASECH